MTTQERKGVPWYYLMRGDKCIHATKDRALSDRLAITYQDVRQVVIHTEADTPEAR